MDEVVGSITHGYSPSTSQYNSLSCREQPESIFGCQSPPEFEISSWETPAPSDAAHIVDNTMLHLPTALIEGRQNTQQPEAASGNNGHDQKATNPLPNLATIAIGMLNKEGIAELYRLTTNT